VQQSVEIVKSQLATENIDRITKETECRDFLRIFRQLAYDGTEMKEGEGGSLAVFLLEGAMQQVDSSGAYMDGSCHM